MSGELKNCPICDHPAQFSEDLCNVYCTFCGCEFGEYAARETEELAEYWNSRPVEDALRAELEQLRKENADLWQQLGEYDAIRAKQVRYEMYLNDESGLASLSKCLKGCIGDIEKQYPTHAWGLSLTIENIEALIVDRTVLRAELARKDEEISTVKEELDHVLRDWNGLVAAVGAKTNGTAIGEAWKVHLDKKDAIIAALDELVEEIDRSKKADRLWRQRMESSPSGGKEVQDAAAAAIEADKAEEAARAMLVR